VQYYCIAHIIKNSIIGMIFSKLLIFCFYILEGDLLLFPGLLCTIYMYSCIRLSFSYLKKTKPTEIRENVYHFYEENHEKAKAFTANHFLAKGVGRSTIYGIISRYYKGIGFTRRVRKCVAPKMTPKRVKRLKAYFNHKDGVSQS